MPGSELHVELLEPKAIRRTALLTVEGERDDICALGQTAAAHDLCQGLRPYMKRHHMQAGAGAQIRLPLRRHFMRNRARKSA